MFTPNGQTLVVAEVRYGTMGTSRTSFWDVSLAERLKVIEGQRGLAISADGTLLATSSADRTLRMLDFATLQEKATAPRCVAEIIAGALRSAREAVGHGQPRRTG